MKKWSIYLNMTEGESEGGYEIEEIVANESKKYLDMT